MEESARLLFDIRLIAVAFFVNILVEVFKRVTPDKKIFHPNILLVFFSISLSLIKCYVYNYCTAENAFMEIVITAIMASGMYEIGWKHVIKVFVGMFFSKEMADEVVEKKNEQEHREPD